jgi:hypothetical protein
MLSDNHFYAQKTHRRVLAHKSCRLLVHRSPPGVQRSQTSRSLAVPCMRSWYQSSGYLIRKKERTESPTYNASSRHIWFLPICPCPQVRLSRCSSLLYYLALTLTLRTERCHLDENMAELFRTLSASEFSLCLQSMLEALSSNGIASDGIAHLIRLVSLALHNAPESQLCFQSRLIKGYLTRETQIR